ncbi:MAG: hypothetical protein ACLVB3_12330 [Clostridium sp.]
MATGALASMGMRAKLRGIKATDGTPIFKSDMQGSPIMHWTVRQCISTERRV